MPYSWDPVSKRYKDIQGRFFPEKEVVKLLDIAIDHKAVARLTMDYKNDLISRETWHQGMRAAVKRAYMQAAMLAAGGRDAMTPQLWGKVGGHVAEQYYHLDRKYNNFLDSIEDLTPKQAVARAKMYIESCRQVYEEIYRDNKLALGAVFERWFISAKIEHCEDCLNLAKMGIVTIGTLGTVPGAGETKCLTSCGCYIRYYNQKRRVLSESLALREEDLVPLTTSEVISYMLQSGEPFDIYLDTQIGDVVVPHKQLNEHFVSKLSAKAPTYISLGEHTGAMVAFHIPEDIAKKLTLPNGLSAKEMHITLTYMGDSRELDKGVYVEQLELFSGSHGSISGKVNGFGRFMASKSSDNQDVIYATFDSPQLPKFRQALVDSLSAKGPDDHGFIPHITLAYIPQDEETPIDKIEKFDLTFDTIYLHWGDEIMEFSLDGK